MGTLVDMNGNKALHVLISHTFCCDCHSRPIFSQWRHWGCITPKIISNIKEKVGDANEVDGFEDLKPEDQEKITKAFENGKVDPADIPDTAKKPEVEGDDAEEEEEKPKKKAPAKRKKKEEEEGDGEEKPKKAPAKRKKKDEEEGDEEEKPKKKPTKRKKKDDDEEGDEAEEKPKKKAAPRKKVSSAV
jgi:hypothetical protein